MHIPSWEDYCINRFSMHKIVKPLLRKKEEKIFAKEEREEMKMFKKKNNIKNEKTKERT